MIRRALVSLLGSSVLVLGCGDDSPATPTDDDGGTTGSASTTSVGPGDSTTGSVDPSATTMVDDSGTTGDPDTGGTSTGADESSTGEPDTCDNGMIDEGEPCDGVDLDGETCISLGFGSGSLQCLPDCSDFDTSNCGKAPSCGDGMVAGAEVCDGMDFAGETCSSQNPMFDSGDLACALDCNSIDTSGCGTCGNVVVDGAEVCDDIVLLGQSCQSQGFDNGTLACAGDCLTYDTSQCGTCGNDIIEGTEEICDNLNNGGEDCLSLGFDSGTLGACQPDCLEFDTSGCGTCGNDIIDGDELCDTSDLGGETCISQGFDNGDLSCDNSDCNAFDTSTCGICGNGVIDGSESCDGMLLGGETCASLGLMGGTLACSASCQFDFTSCDIPGIPFGSDTGYNGFALTPPMTTCDDISATGTATGLTDDDNVVVPLGFTFPVYGVDRTDANIQSNGTLRFGDMSYLTFGNQCLPTVTAPSTNTLYVFWDDLNPTVGAGEVYYQTLGAPGDQRFVVQWDVANFGGDALDLMRFQVVLHELTGQIDVCYVDTINAGNSADLGAEATAGIQQNSGDGFQYSCNTPDLVDGLQLLYIPI